MANKTRMINCLPAPSRKFNEHSTINPEVGARCRQAVTSLRRCARMKKISKAAWDRVIEKACDVANATRTDNDPMFDVYREQMLELLDELEADFGIQSRILDTRAD